jgi:RTX calcium-binding nonapeptide repeat (4 copies)
VTVVLLVPSTAAASTAAVTEHGPPVQYATLSYVAGDGEANDLLVQGDAHSIVLTDPGAEIDPGSGCTTSGDHSVTCTSQLEFYPEPVHATLGDEDDRFTSEGPFFEVDGGAGDDVLKGGAAGGSFQGGDGDDVLEGGAHRTYFDGGDGADEMIGTDEYDYFLGGPGPDTMDGRGQVAASERGDTISYRNYAEPVTIDMSKPASIAGAEGEGDTISNFEDASGGAGSDTITAKQEVWSPRVGSTVSGWGGDDVIQGGPGSDALYGMDGDDTIRGAGGDDYMSGEAGRDTLLGEGGSNTLIDFDPGRDLLDCGDGGTAWPGLAGMRLLHLIDQSCRRVQFEYLPITTLRYRYDGRPTRAVATILVCKERCLITVALHAHGKLQGAVRREIRQGHRAALTVPLGDKARAELAQAGALRLHFSMDVKWGNRLRHRQATSWNLLLHDPPSAR